MTASASGSTPVGSIDEVVRRQFERAWSDGRPQAIELFLPAESASTYLPTLEELVHIELEMMWKAWRPEQSPPGLVEAYLPRFPALNQPAIRLRLLEQEWRLRHRYGDRATVDEYRRRFPEADLSGLEMSATLSSTVPSSDAAAATLPQVPGYEVLDELGRGGMGIVYRARQLKLKRLVALKMIRAGVHADEEERQRFLNEAEAVARLQHPNIVQIHESASGAAAKAVRRCPTSRWNSWTAAAWPSTWPAKRAARLTPPAWSKSWRHRPSRSEAGQHPIADCGSRIADSRARRACTIRNPLGTTQVLTWKGTSGLLGWGGLAPTLSPELRGPLAYVAGHRYRRLNQPAEAANFFRAALLDAKPDSSLRRLTQVELDRQKR